MHNKFNICRVCGNIHYSFPWGEFGDTASFEICACCGTTFGYEDATLNSIKKKRKEWIQTGAKWFTPKEKPDNWLMEKSLENIPEKYK